MARRRLLASTLLCASGGMAGCINLAPDHRRPDAPVAASWSARGAAPFDGRSPVPQLDAASAATLGWDRFIADERLRAVVASALRNNRDLRVALLDVERARAATRIQEAARLPSLDGAASGTRTRSDGVTASTWSATLVASYEVDLFGRVRNLNDAAVATFLATREAQRGVQVLIVSEVATAWLNLGADKERLAVARQTLASQQRSLDLAVRMRALGASNGLAVAQARGIVEAVRVQVAAIETQIGLDRNALELLLGATVDAGLEPDARPVVRASALFGVQPDLPSSILVDRPDVQAAERRLQSATANIGAARAAFFPRILLTGTAGRASNDLRGLFASSGGLLGFGPSVTVPVFDGGLNAANLDAARVDRDAAVAAYEKSLQNAFREVADVLVQRGTLAERTDGQEALVDALETSFRLSDAVFRQGGSSYLQVLDAQRSLYAAQQGLISLRLEEQATRIALYRALGGGWSDGDAAR